MPVEKRRLGPPRREEEKRTRQEKLLGKKTLPPIKRR